ncbi:hypothetical protein ACFZBU_10970 [Embleya sp. NPDC008237]|uniref:hypothetical protein n=1 Tax=Embleya sp. NPDC008237 TaxID=3363978 RepID=UPI0036EA68B1
MPVTTPPDLHNLIISGFGDHDTDFEAAFDNSSEEAQERIRQQVVNEAARAEMIPEEGKFCSVTVIAHSDRVDDAPTSEQARADELQVSVERGDNALLWLFDQIQQVVQDAGATVPASVDDMQSVNVFRVACGAAHLLFPVPTPDERPENRRVEFAVASFAPEETPVL